MKGEGKQPEHIPTKWRREEQNKLNQQKKIK
jgi:hypothetical protein